MQSIRMRNFTDVNVSNPSTNWLATFTDVFRLNRSISMMMIFRSDDRIASQFDS